MATDSFTTGSDTVLSTYDANWALAGGFTNTATVYQATDVVGNTTGFQHVSYRYSASSSDDCQMVKKGNSGLSGVRHSVLVRANASRVGYGLRLATDGGTHTGFTVTKNGVEIGGGDLGSTAADTADVTLRIQATANGANQEIRVWVNGVQQTFGYATGTGFTRIDTNLAIQDDGTGSAVLSDGSPGFHNTSSADLADTYWDDFDDLAGTGPATVTKLKLLAHSSAASATGIAGVVFEAPTGGAVTGAKIGEFTGAAFEASLEDGKAVLKVATSEFDTGSPAAALTTSDTPVALVRNSSNTTGIVSCTVIEE